MSPEQESKEETFLSYYRVPFKSEASLPTSPHFQPGLVSIRKPKVLVFLTIDLLYQKEGPTLQEPLLLAPRSSQ